MGFYGIMVVEYFKKFSSLRCLAGFNERTATMGLKKCLSINDCSKEYWTCIQVRSSKSPKVMKVYDYIVKLSL
jgi:hypothetical protein